MEDLGSFWSFDENIDALKLKLQYAKIELETVRMEANDEISKCKEELKHLLNLLKLPYQERDEANDQLQKLATRFIASGPTEFHTTLSHAHPGSPLVIATRANSSITESNSLSDTKNHQSHVSSSVDSLFEVVTSPEFSSFNVADSCNMGFLNQSFAQKSGHNSVPTGLAYKELSQIEPADAIIDNVLRGRALPEQGKLLHAVMEGGPLLQTLLLAGPLPSWRNPPPLQPFKIPPVSIKGCDKLKNASQKSAPAAICAQRSFDLVQNVDLCRWPAKLCSASLLGSSSSNPLIQSGKRQRFQ